MRLLLFFLLTAFFFRCLQAHTNNASKEYALLEAFLRKGFSEEEEYGYVLEGIKPISIRNFQAIDSFLTPRYLDWEILVHEAIPVWNRVCQKQKNYIFKAVVDEESTLAMPGFELQFINISRLKEVIDAHLALFRYVLGPLVTTDQIIDQIVYSEKPLGHVLKNNLTLIGIVLGYGLHNSLMEAKIGALSDQVLVKDEAPFLPQHRFFRNTTRQKFLLPEEIYRLYYLQFAGGDESRFKENFQPLETGSGFSNLDEELELIQSQEEPLPLSLQKENPRFVFSAFKGGASNYAFFEQLEHAQKWIQSLLKEEDFLERVVEKITGEKPCFTDSLPTGVKSAFHQSEKEWYEILLSIGRRFDDSGRVAFIDAVCQPSKTSRKHPWAIGVSQATLEGLKQARRNLAEAEKKFTKLCKERPDNIKELHQGLLYYKTMGKGIGKRISEKMDRIKVNYVVKDQNNEVLFAKYNTWIHLRDTIAGFAHGVQGMHVNENRVLYIHPALGYGALTTLPSCTALTIKVRLLDVDEEMLCKETLPLLQPHDLTWVNDHTLYKNIEESLLQIPSYVGSFYRDWLDKQNSLNKQLIIAALNKSKATEKKPSCSVDAKECELPLITK